LHCIVYTSNLYRYTSHDPGHAKYMPQNRPPKSINTHVNFAHFLFV